jgi:hypothetical protein
MEKSRVPLRLPVQVNRRLALTRNESDVREDQFVSGHSDAGIFWDLLCCCDLRWLANIEPI